MLQCDGLVLKPIHSPPKGDCEHNFYKRIFLSEPSDLLYDYEVELRKFMPIYRGYALVMQNDGKTAII
jgi:hypothetical protein